MTQRLDLQPGLRFGRLVLTGERETKNGKIYEKCLCDCGNTWRVRRAALRNGNTTSCGCYQRECAKNILTKHGMGRSRICKIFKGIRDRCYKKCNASYKNYGAKGIKCERENFEDFYRDMGESYNEHVKKYGEKQTTIDRINHKGNYCKENCKWSTYTEQNRNRGDNVRCVYKGTIYSSITEMSEIFGIEKGTLTKRIESGWDIDRAIETPVRKYLHHN